MEKLHLKTLAVVLMGLFIGITLTSAVSKVQPMANEKTDQKTKEKPQTEGIHFINPINKDGSEKLFTDVISQFKGKVVYIDFWASWCPPCRQQMPYSANLHREYEGKDVVFLYVSFDRSEAAWKKGIEKYNIQGYHILPQQKLGMDINSKYQVTGIPRYMLVDKNGKVVNTDAPRPVQKQQLVTQIDKLLAQK